MINTQYHPTARVKIRRTEILDGGSMDGEVLHYTYRVFEKGPGSNKRTTWIYKSDITLKDAIAGYCKFKGTLDKFPSFWFEGREVRDQWERLLILHHLIEKCKIAEKAVVEELEREMGMRDLACLVPPGR